MAKKRGLGRGLDALIPTAPAQPAQPVKKGGSGRQKDSAEAKGGIVEIAVSAIKQNPRQPRVHIEQVELEELAASIKEHGVIQPLVVARTDIPGQFTLVAGQRRWKASGLAGLEKVPAVIREAATDQELLELALVENIQRSDLSPLESATAYQSLADDFGMSHEKIAKRVGKSRTAVTNTMRLLKLLPDVQNALSDGVISEGHARALLALKHVPTQLQGLQVIEKNGLNVRQTEDLVRRLNGAKPSAPPPPERMPEEVDLENRFRDSFGTKVKLNRNEKGKGTIVIHFYSDEELNDLSDRFLQ